MAKAVADDYLRRIPKAELHCHLAGTLRATTVAELAATRRPRPAAAGRASSTNGPISTASWTCCGSPRSSCARPEDFARAVYEYRRGCRARRQPQACRVLLQSRLLLSQRHRLSVDGRRHDRRHRGGEEEVRRVAASDLLHRPLDQHAGPGASRSSRRRSPTAATMWSASASTAPSAPGRRPPSPRPMRWPSAAGLHRTAHCCEDNQTLVEAPPTNYLICRDVLQLRPHRPRLQHAGLGFRDGRGAARRPLFHALRLDQPGAQPPAPPAAHPAHGRGRPECHHQHRRSGDVRDRSRPWLHDPLRVRSAGARTWPASSA